MITVGVNRALVQIRHSGRDTFEKENLIQCKSKELNEHPGTGSDPPFELDRKRFYSSCSIEIRRDSPD